MKRKRILKFGINSFFLLITLSLLAQVKSVDYTKNKRGLRLGFDISKPIQSIIDANKKGYQIVADINLTNTIYIASEVGYNDNLTKLDYLNFLTKGSYLKLGLDYNSYKNWLTMNNQIYVGFRYGYSSFSQTLNSYQVNSSLTLPLKTVNTPIVFSNLNGQWVELVFGIKAEILHHIYLGFSFSGKKIIATKEPSNFKNLFIPGFNRVFLNNTGFGFNYTISYLIPFHKKSKK